MPSVRRYAAICRTTAPVSRAPLTVIGALTVVGPMLVDDMAGAALYVDALAADGTLGVLAMRRSMPATSGGRTISWEWTFATVSDGTSPPSANEGINGCCDVDVDVGVVYGL